MGTVFTIWSPLLAAAITFSVPAVAQDNSAAPLPSLTRPANPPPLSPNRPQQQGPELDVFRDVPGTATQPVTPPPAVTTTTPPIITPTPVPARPTTVPRPRVQPAPEPMPAPTTPDRLTTPAKPSTLSPSAVVTTPQHAPSPVTAPPATAPLDQGTPWGWIGAAFALLLAGGIVLWLRRRSHGDAVDEPDAIESVAPESSVPPSTAHRPTPPAQPTTERPWIDIVLAIDAASHGPDGVSIRYRLTLHNRGKAAAIDLLIHALIGQADANQNDLLRAFFAGTKGMPVHSVVTIAPGQSTVLTNDIQLAPGDVEPLELDGRLLLVPLLGFDVHYRWDAKGMPAGGRSGSAFVIGQEQVPPTERLAPFRFDLGPRHYGAVGCRRTALSLTR